MKRTVSPLSLFLLVIAVGLFNLCAHAQETILSFDSEIEVQRDGSMIVQETIQVRAEGNRIKRGIYRDFPQLYKRRSGLMEKRPFEVLSVTRNGSSEPYSTQQEQAGIRLLIGNKDVPLPKNTIQTYQIRYRTDRQLIFSKKHDELYWNVTGNEWMFFIEKATAKVTLPEGIQAIQTNGFTGVKGAHGKAFTVSELGNPITFSTQRRLLPAEGFSIVVFWPPGSLDATAYEPPSLIAENKMAVLGMGLTGVAVVCYLIVWMLVGRDPRRGVIIPRWQPPADWSPSAVRYLKKMGFDDTAFSAGVISLASKGRLQIEDTGDQGHLLTQRDPPKNAESLTSDEATLLDSLFTAGSPLLLNSENYTIVHGARSRLSRSLKEMNRERFFRGNTQWWAACLLLSVLGMLALFSAQPDPFSAGWATLGLGVYFVICIALWAFSIGSFYEKWFTEAVLFLCFAILLSSFMVRIVPKVMREAGVLTIAAFAVALGCAILFYWIRKAPTKDGREVLDEIDGFKEYLSVAEEDRLNLQNPPTKTPELFEKFLPYALALGVEQQWSEKFDAILRAASHSPQSSHKGNYSPSFYVGDASKFTTAAVGSAMGIALTSALISASTAPSSSSGGGDFGGGGGSGGGGGGGGGGGW